MAHVLVVEDDPTVAEVVVSYLRHAGLEATHVSDGAEAVPAFLATSPDLVVLDLMLPHVDGLEICRRLRALDAPANAVPVVMLTALGEEEDRVAGLVVGADDYVTKPFSPRELVLRVQSVLRRSAAGADAARHSRRPGHAGRRRPGRRPDRAPGQPRRPRALPDLP